MISKSKIDNIGNTLKANQPLNDIDYQILLDWRDSFTSILDYYHTKLKSNLDEQNMVTLSRRLKRIESIQRKLVRFPTMRLSTLQDIAGLRVVLKDSDALLEAFSTLRSLSNKHKLKRVDNYHSNPKADGYRGFHLIYQNESDLQIEVQLRTELEHIWATAVEIYGELQATSFKTGSGDSEWMNFFALLSSLFAIKENAVPTESHIKLSEKTIRRELKKKIKELNVIERLNASTNSIEIITSKYNQIGRAGKYALIELDLILNKTTVELFNKKDVKKAILLYTKKEFEAKKSLGRNVVFVNVDDIKKIQSSYPNYFLDTKKLLTILGKIVLDEY